MTMCALTCRSVKPEELINIWNSIPGDCREPYWHPQFLFASASWEKAHLQCLSIQNKTGRLLYPYLCHPISGYDQIVRNSLFDVQTAYGYGGPLFLGDWATEEKIEALKRIAEYLHEQGAVAEFVRCHTAWCAPAVFEGAGYQVIKVRTNVECDLEANGTSDFSKTWAPVARRNLRIARRAGLRYRLGASIDDVTQFCRLYFETYQRIGMAPFYRFDMAYFRELSSLPSEHVALILVESPNEPHLAIASALVLIGAGRAYYHLGGSDLRYRGERLNDFLYWAMADEAQKRGCRRIVWGGGTSDSEEDTLFRFKRHFGNILTPVFVAGRVLDQTTYDNLCAEWARRNSASYRESRMFLQYRA
jgi:hypothetical protein